MLKTFPRLLSLHQHNERKAAEKIIGKPLACAGGIPVREPEYGWQSQIKTPYLAGIPLNEIYGIGNLLAGDPL